MNASALKHWNIILILLLLLTLAFIWGNSLLTRAESQEISRGLLAELCAVLENVGLHIDPQNDHWLRKLAHFGEFGLLGAELCLLMWMNRRQSVQGFINCAFAGLAVAVDCGNRGHQNRQHPIGLCLQKEICGGTYRYE